MFAVINKDEHRRGQYQLEHSRASLKRVNGILKVQRLAPE
jgi:hypothetical protein